MNARPPAVTDFDEVLALLRAADLAVVGESDWTEADLRRDWEELDLEHDAWVIEADGRIGGYAFFEDRSGGKMVGDGYVHPELHGRGIGSRLQELVERRAHEQARTLPVGTRAYLRSGVLGSDERSRDLHEGRGYRLAEQQFRMVIDLDEAPPEPQWPAGVRAEELSLADGRAVYETLREAFDDWRQSFEDFRDKRLGSPRFDPGLCRTVKANGEMIGATLCDWKRHGDWGWIGSIGVRPEWRGRGIGRALLVASFAEFWRRGERKVALGVTAENPTGAVALYESVGMYVLWRIDVYEKDIRG